jgi:YHS domain-containing protein
MMTSLGDLLWIAALGGLFYYMMSRGGGCCSGHNHGDHSQENHKGQENDHEHTAYQLQSVDKNTVDSPVEQDPVCGMEINKVASAPASKHFGRTFHFCSEQCRKLFDINPGKYAGSV